MEEVGGGSWRRTCGTITLPSGSSHHSATLCSSSQVFFPRAWQVSDPHHDRALSHVCHHAMRGCAKAAPLCMGGVARSTVLRNPRSLDTWMRRGAATVSPVIVSFAHSCMMRSRRAVRRLVDIVVSHGSCSKGLSALSQGAWMCHVRRVNTGPRCKLPAREAHIASVPTSELRCQPGLMNCKNCPARVIL